MPSMGNEDGIQCGVLCGQIGRGHAAVDALIDASPGSYIYTGGSHGSVQCGALMVPVRLTIKYFQMYLNDCVF